MDPEASVPLQRSVSQQSSVSVSQRSQTVRRARKLSSQPSSSASSIAASDKSLTSFPSFSPDSPREERPLSTSPEPPQPSATLPPASIVDDLTTSSSPQLSAARRALFEDAPPSSKKIPGALHHADDKHIERLISRHGAANLVRQIAEDLAQRDVQMATLRRKADERERALRKIVLECGLSNLDLETRLRKLEQEASENRKSRRAADDSGLSDLMTDAMADDFKSPFAKYGIDSTAVRPGATNAENPNGTLKGWKDYLWGTGTTKKASGNGKANEPLATDPQQTVVRVAPPGDRRPTLSENLFNQPEAESAPSSSRASSVYSGFNGRKTSLASLALRLVAGGTSSSREADTRGRADSANPGSSLRTPSTSSAKTHASTRAVSTQGGPRALMAMRRNAGHQSIPVSGPSKAQALERWDAMTAGSSPTDAAVARSESYGPVEMDTILPPEGQPPTQTHIYNNHQGSEFLTDPFGFIYDQRRKRRQGEAAQMARHFKRSSRSEMLANGRFGLYSGVAESGSATKNSDGSSEGRPGSPSSTEDARDEAKPKRWQDYLKIATFPTELLSHTPSISVPGFEVMEGGEAPKSPTLITSEERGFLPSTSPTTALDSETRSTTEADQASGTLVKEDAEPVKLLLRQLSELHDNLQRERTVRWNDFLRKVRAERKREGEAAAAAAAAAAEARFQRATAIMPEAKLADGEMIGVAGLGNKGKVGRAKWNEFKILVLGGIPVAYRPKVWTECSGAGALRVPGYFESLVAQAPDNDDPQVTSQIRADITRTLTDNIFFRKGPGIAKLNEVLVAYSRRNIEVGYCQGMNLVVANLLLIIPSAEDVFWILVSMIETILPTNYYDHSLLASRADQQVLRTYVSEVLPKLSQHFDELAIDLEAMTFQWFLSVFTDCLSAEALFRVWDVVLCTNDGSTFLFQVALALLKLNEQQLLGCSSPASVYTYINHQMTNHAISIDGLIQASEALKRVVKREDVEARRSKAIEVEKDTTRQREERQALRRSQKAAAAAAAAASAGENNEQPKPVPEEPEAESTTKPPDSS